MTKDRGKWVEIEEMVLRPSQRTGNIPEETRKVPLMMRAKGFLTEEAKPGDRVKIRTLTGRIIEGTLTKMNPTYDHGFGAEFIPELLEIGISLRAIMEGNQDER